MKGRYHARLRDLIDNPPMRCGDHSCAFGGPKGMGTNGGCRCASYPEDMSRSEWARVKSWISSLRYEADALMRRVEDQET